MFVRFVIANVDPDSGARQGLFMAAASLHRANVLSLDEASQLDAILKWFNLHLAKPARFNRSAHRKAKAISWFKSSAKAHIARIRAMANMLEAHGIHVEMIKEHRLGYIVYEDDYQVAAEPFRDTVT